MLSLSVALKGMRDREVTVWLNHSDMKMLGGIVDRTEAEHFELLSGDVRFFVPYTAVVAVAPST